MRLLFVLHKDNIELAKWEVLCLAKADTKNSEIYNNNLIIDTKKDIDLLKRLAFTRSIYEFLFFAKNIKDYTNFDWNSIYESSYSLRPFNPEINRIIWKNLKNPSVALKGKRTQIEVIKTESHADKEIVTKKIVSVKHDFQKRRAHLRPKNHPTSLSPKLARAMINLTGLSKGKIFDPFCGSGGILIEAGLMGFKTLGFDISEKMLSNAKQNLEYFSLNSVLKQRDSTKHFDEAYDAIVTELPFGKGSKITEPVLVILRKFIDSSKNAKIRVISVPDTLEINELIKKIKLKKIFNVFIHRSLNKKILLF